MARLCWLIVAIYVAIIATIHVWSFQGVARGEGFSTKDFDAFYAASMLMERLPPATLFDQAASRPVFEEAQQRLYGPMSAAQKAQVPPLRWYYPPSFLLAVAPLDLVPPIPAYLLWLTLTALPFLWALRRALGSPLALPAGLAWPGSFMTGLFGQNGFLTAGLIGGGLELLERRPLLAGALFGLASYKPHLALPVGLALLAGRYWRAAFAATVSAALVSALSAVLFGLDVWAAFLTKGASMARTALENGDNPWTIMPTAFAAMRSLGAGIPLSWGVQGLTSLTALGVILWAWSRPGGVFRMKAAILVVGGLLATPFGYVYDMTLLALPLAWLLAETRASGWRPYERLAAVAGLLTPFAAPAFAKLWSFQPGPLMLAGLLVVLVRRFQCPERPNFDKSKGMP